MSTTKKQYEKPAITYTQPVTTRAVACDKADETNCAGGVISS